MSHEYLCLYTDAFVIETGISRTITNRHERGDQSMRDHLRSAFSNVAHSRRPLHLGERAAAKSFLTLVSTQINPVKHLKYVPLWARSAQH
jgi:hypothetical protein